MVAITQHDLTAWWAPALAFAAGVVSFASPCVFPLVPGYVSFVTLSTNQSINLKILDGTTQVGNTMVVDGALSASASIPFTLEAAFVETGAVTIHFTEGAAAVDANTTVFINSIIVLAES